MPEGTTVSRRPRASAHDLCDPTRIIAVSLVWHRPHRRLGLARLDADRRDAGLGEPSVQPRRQRTSLQADPLHLHPRCPEECNQYFRLAGRTRLAHDITCPIDDTNLL